MVSLLDYYDFAVPYEYLYYLTSFDSGGLSLYNIKKTLEYLGFECEAKKGILDKNARFPCLAHISLKGYYHYVIVCCINNVQVKIMDPAYGKRKLSCSEFFAQATGNYLFLKPTAHLKKIIVENNVQKYINNYIKKHRIFYFSLLTLLFSSLFLELLTLFQLKIFVNNLIMPGVIKDLNHFVILFLVLIGEQTFLKILISYYEEYALYELKTILKNYVLKHVITLPYPYLMTREKDRILSFLQDAELISQYEIKERFSNIRTFIFLLFLISYLYFYSSFLSLFIILVNVIFYLFVFIEKKGLEKDLSSYMKKQDYFHQILHRFFFYVDTIKGNHLENGILKKLKKQNISYEKVKMKLMIRKYREQSIFFFLDGFLYLLLLAVVVYFFVKDNTIIHIGTFLLVEGFIRSILRSEEALMTSLLLRKEYKKAKDRLNELLFLKNEVFLPHHNFIFPKEYYELKIENLTYRYSLIPVLKEINITILKGMKLFFYGQSGSGKSTFFKLIGRYLEVPYGIISLNNRDINHYNLDLWRQEITYLSASILLEEGTLQDNIILDKEENKDELDTILWICGLDKVLVHKKEKITTKINEENHYSTGEIMRIGLARSLYRDSQIYLFDECFSNLDIKSEKEILTRLFKWKKDKTILVISHRLTNKDLFDHIFIFRKGKLYEKAKK